MAQIIVFGLLIASIIFVVKAYKSVKKGIKVDWRNVEDWRKYRKQQVLKGFKQIGIAVLCFLVMFVTIGILANNQEKQDKVKAAELAKYHATPEYRAKVEAEKKKEAEAKAQEEVKKKAEELAKQQEQAQQQAIANDNAYLRDQVYVGQADVHKDNNEKVYAIEYNNKALVSGLIQQVQIGNTVANGMLNNLIAVAENASLHISPDWKIRIVTGEYSMFSGYHYSFEIQAIK